MIGKELGQYQVVEPLGEGGMASVYKGYDKRLDRDVAIKVILPGFSHSSAFLKRFEREAKSIARLTHINIVKVINYGFEEGMPYLVMEYVPGGTLKDLLGKPIPWEKAVQMLVPIARALEYAHNRNIIHRDIKPANFLVTHSGDLVISDFGIAKTLDEDLTKLTGTGVSIGTPAYMSPEQGLHKEVDHRIDIYSLGIVFFEMVTGRAPFEADTPFGVMMKHVSDPLPRPRDFISNLPEEVEKVLFKALEKDPADRYQSMAEFAEALEKLWRIQEKQIVVKESVQEITKVNEVTQETLDQKVLTKKIGSVTPIQRPATKKINFKLWGSISGIALILIIILMAFWFLGKNNSRVGFLRQSETQELTQTITIDLKTETKTSTPKPSPSQTLSEPIFILSDTPTRTDLPSDTPFVSSTPTSTLTPNQTPTDEGCNSIDLTGYWEGMQTYSSGYYSGGYSSEIYMTIEQKGCRVSGDITIFYPYGTDDWVFVDNTIEDGWLRYYSVGNVSKHFQIIDENTLASYKEDSPTLIIRSIVKRVLATPTIFPDNAIEVPDVIGLSVNEATNILEKGSFDIRLKYVEDSDYPLGTVIEQDTEPGLLIEVGSQIKLTVVGEYVYIYHESKSSNEANSYYTHEFNLEPGIAYTIYTYNVSPNSQTNITFYWDGRPILSGTESSGGSEYINYTPDVSGRASIFVQLITQGSDVPISYEVSVYYVKTSPE